MFNNRRPDQPTRNSEKLVVVASFEAQKPIKSSSLIKVNDNTQSREKASNSRLARVFAVAGPPRGSRTRAEAASALAHLGQP